MWCITMGNDITVNTHCDVTMGRWHCLGNHMMQTMGSDVAPVQGGASVQLYHKALSIIVHVY